MHPSAGRSGAYWAVQMDRYVAPWFDRERRLPGLRGVDLTCLMSERGFRSSGGGTVVSPRAWPSWISVFLDEAQHLVSDRSALPWSST
jgi:hypothetical protein